MGKNFSVVMPVRNNIGGLLLSLAAFQAFTYDKAGLEVLLFVDDDDNDLERYKAISKNYGYDIHVNVVGKSDNFSENYYNRGAKMSSATNIFAFNDDCYIQTAYWDKIIMDKIKMNSQFKGIYLVDIMDSTRKAHFTDDPKYIYPKFPVISKKAVDTIGFFFHPKVRIWPADKIIWDLYKAVGCVITCHDVKIQHDHNFNHETDPSKNRMLRVLNEDKANGVFPIDGTQYVKALYKAIDGKDLV